MHDIWFEFLSALLDLDTIDSLCGSFVGKKIRKRKPKLELVAFECHILIYGRSQRDLR